MSIVQNNREKKGRQPISPEDEVALVRYSRTTT